MKLLTNVALCLCLVLNLDAAGKRKPYVHHPPPVHRSREARASFARSHPCPATGKPYGGCPGYVVDHVKPLACGGPDAPSNMQWQTVAEGKRKDKVERIGCR